mmetsp:Transcript_59450/g.174013  ORF Transcript_59450/g.174013 Transcript_59450/m.174013 type:complete len:284 (-) Transcript_59450:922-1773(-)
MTHGSSYATMSMGGNPMSTSFMMPRATPARSTAQGSRPPSMEIKPSRMRFSLSSAPSSRSRLSSANLKACVFAAASIFTSPQWSQGQMFNQNFALSRLPILFERISSGSKSLDSGRGIAAFFSASLISEFASLTSNMDSSKFRCTPLASFTLISTRDGSLKCSLAAAKLRTTSCWKLGRKASTCRSKSSRRSSRRERLVASCSVWGQRRACAAASASLTPSAGAGRAAPGSARQGSSSSGSEAVKTKAEPLAACLGSAAEYQWQDLWEKPMRPPAAKGTAWML